MFHSQLYIADTLAVQAECLALLLIAAPPMAFGPLLQEEYFSNPRLLFYCFSSLSRKHETGTIKGQNLLTANHLDQSIYQVITNKC
jgi:hypothetical protein